MEPAIRSSCSTAVEREFCAIGKPMELINHIIDQRAHQSPELLYAEIPLSSTRFEDGFRKATYSAFANAINGVAWWLSEQLGVGKQFKTLVYLGPNDLRHNILLFGAVKAGYKASNIFASIMLPIFCMTIVVYPFSSFPSSVKAAAEALKYTKVNAMNLTPPHIEEIASDPVLLHHLSKEIDTLFWAGGDISAAAGDPIPKKIRLFTANGSTEMGMWPTLYPSGNWPLEHWKYMHVRPSMQLEFRHRSGELYEAVIQRRSTPETEQPVFKIFPNIQEYSVGDLFSQHPSEPQLWQYDGRVDDLLVFATGEKFHPASVEKHITGHPEVESTLLVGDQRPQAALLIAMNTGESLYSAEERSKAISRLWPTIIESNETCPVYAKLTKSHILFAHAQKPMVKTGKGAVQRSATIGLYEEELDRLFARASEPSASATASAHTLITDS